MADGGPISGPISWEAFGEAAARLGISAPEEHMDELFRQVRGALQGAASLRDINVSQAEPDMAFMPTGRPAGGPTGGTERS